MVHLRKYRDIHHWGLLLFFFIYSVEVVLVDATEGLYRFPWEFSELRKPSTFYATTGTWYEAILSQQARNGFRSSGDVSIFLGIKNMRTHRRPPTLNSTHFKLVPV